MNGMVRIREATIEDGEFILSVRNDPTTIAFLHTTTTFDLENFKQWFLATDPQMFIIEDKEPVGYLRTKWLEDNVLQVGADIHPQFRRKGYAQRGYKLLFEKYPEVKKFNLEVLNHNVIAQNLYEKLGFVVVREYDYENGMGSTKSIVMEKTNE